MLNPHKWNLDWHELDGCGDIRRSYAAFNNDLTFEVDEHFSGAITGVAYRTSTEEIVFASSFDSRGTAMFTLEKLEG